MADRAISAMLRDVADYLRNLQKTHREKIEDCMRLLEVHGGRLGRPHSDYIRDGIRELRIDFNGLAHRVLYALLPQGKILLITAFLKKTRKTPIAVIERAKLIFRMYQQTELGRSKNEDTKIQKSK